MCESGLKSELELKLARRLRFLPGDRVRRKSGGPAMVIEEVRLRGSAPRVTCSRRDGRRWRVEDFRADELEHLAGD